MNCRSCSSKNTRVVCTEHRGHVTKRWCRCLDCGEKFRTLEQYEKPKAGPARGYQPHPNQVRRGTENHSAVLTEENIVQIRTLASENQTYASIAETFGIHKDTVYRIVKRKLWKHVK